MERLCPRCNRLIPEGARFCQGCGFEVAAPAPNFGGPAYSRPHPPIKNYLVESIIVTAICCLPLGIVALLHSLRVDNEIARGDYASAQRSADLAKKYSIWGAAGYFIFVGAVFVFALLLALFSEPRFEPDDTLIPPSVREL